jgi:plasmid replication initiation protein
MKLISNSTERVKKHVAAIHTSGELSLLERKMANVLLLNAYDELLTKPTHTLPVKHLCAMLGWDDSNNTERLQEALRKLNSTSIEFNMMEDGKQSWHVMSMLSYGNIEQGICTYRYDEYLAKRLYDPEIYAIINIGIQQRFEGSYALTLYENCLRYKSVGTTGWLELDVFKKIMGANYPMYGEFKYLKRNVIDKPIEEINRVSDIQLLAEFKKQGRKVSAVRFMITESPQQALLKPVIEDDYAAIRESELFKKLLEHGIGKRLAILWISQDEVRVREVVNYVETKAHKKQVKGATAGYIRTLYEGDAVVGKTPFEEKNSQEEQGKKDEERRKAQEKRRLVLEAEFLREHTTATIKAFSLEEKRAWAAIYIAEVGSATTQTYNAETASFRVGLERVQFLAWLHKRLAPQINPAEYKAWLKKKGHDVGNANSSSGKL